MADHLASLRAQCGAHAGAAPGRVSRQLTGDWCEEVVVAAALARTVSRPRLPDNYVARS